MGYTASLVVAPLRQHPDIRELHLFHGPKDANHIKALAAVRQVAATFGVRIVDHTTKHGFDFDEALRLYVQAYDKVPEKEDVLFNASSGPRPMIMAATIFCFTHDVPLVYYDEYDTKQGKRIPLTAYRSIRGLGDTKRALVRNLQKKGSLDMGTLAKALKLGASTVSVHVHELATMDIVGVQRDGKRVMVTLRPEMATLDLEAVA
jgi:DNA-binding transcriptional ArsR family regulator